MNSFLLKIIMVIFMFIDHVGYFLPNIPIEFRYVGRVVLPVFAFLMVEGYVNTKNRENYLKRLVIGAQIMSIGNIILTIIAPKILGVNKYILDYFNVGIAVVLSILTIYMLIKNINNTTFTDGMALKSLAIIVIAGVSVMNGFARDINPLVNNIFVSLALSFVMLNGMNRLDDDGATTTDVTKIFIVLALAVFSEGALITPIIVYIFYKYRKQNILKYILYVVVCLMFLPGLNVERLLLYPQWMQIFAIVFMMLYNGKRGANIKIFFYIFYPIHIWILFILGLLLK
ncbi:MAG: TraX family protein [Clostridium sp.]